MKKFMSRRMKIFLSVLTTLTISCYIAAAIVLYNSNFNFSSYSDSFHGDWSFGWGNHNSMGTIEKELPQTVQNINLSTTSSEYTVEFYSGTTLKVDISGDFFSNFTYSDGLSKLEITDSNVYIETNNNLNFSDLDITVYIPDTYKNLLSIKSASGELSVNRGNLKNLIASSASGGINLYNVEANDTSLEAASGSITASNFKTNKSIVKTASGDISIQGFLGETNVSAASGSVDLNLSDLAGISNFSANSGDIDLMIPSGIGYKLTFSTNTGSLSGKNFHGDVNMNSTNTYTNGDGSKIINAKTTTGDLRII